MITISQMNHVNLIGQMVNEPKTITLPNGKKVIRFSMSTKETYLDEEGNNQQLQNWHQIVGWGKWVQVIEKMGSKGQALAIEGKLCSRFYHTKSGQKKSITEVEINDLVVL